MDETIKYGNWEIVNQVDWPISNPDMLDTLMDICRRVEDATGFRWKVTSYLRKSPSHKTGSAIDIAPDIANHAVKDYSVTKLSDPVLYKREFLLRALQKVVKSLPVLRYKTGIFVEPDHLHIGLFIQDGIPPSNSLVKWGITKPIYHDTESRSQLPLIEGFKPLQS